MVRERRSIHIVDWGARVVKERTTIIAILNWRNRRRLEDAENEVEIE